MNSTDIDSILAGLDDLIDEWLGVAGNTRFGTAGLPAYYSRTAAIDLSVNRGPLSHVGPKPDATARVRAMFERIDANWKAMGSRPPSKMVWELRQALHLADESTSPEKILEKLVVRLLHDPDAPRWFNQIPTCSGMAERRESHRSVDLGHDCGNGEFELIELKYGTAEQNFGSDHPLYAAFEVVKYGLLYAHSRAFELHGIDPGNNALLKATGVHLLVLAPSGYYQYKERSGKFTPYDFHWLERSLNEGLRSLRLPASLDFRFQRFTSEFEALYGQASSLAESVRSFQRNGLTSREPVYP
jgi:hypothetical protein